jgi:hypothetical protein
MEESCCGEFLALVDWRFEGFWDGGDCGSSVCDFVA